MKETLAAVARDAKAEDDFVLILIGHGSFDGVEYKFNLVGPDMTAGEIAAMCDRIPSRRQLVVDTTSASGGAMQALERPGRAVIAATKSGTEKNATVFARYWVEALQDPAADTDKSDSISAMEAFTYATKKTAAFYDSQKRLATEHAVFDDVGRGEPVREAGNGQGALMSSFTLLRLGTSQQAANDPAKRALLAKKEELEQKIDTLKYQKAAMDPADYKKQLTTRWWSWRRCRRGWTNETPRYFSCAVVGVRRYLRRCVCCCACGLLVAAQAWASRGGAGMLRRA